MSLSPPSAWGSQGFCLPHQIASSLQLGFSISCPLSLKVPALGKRGFGWLVEDQGREAQAPGFGDGMRCQVEVRGGWRTPHLLDPCVR